MASAFDESYQESLNALRTLQSNYDTKMKALVALYQGNLDDAYPKAEELAVYGTKLAELQSRILENNQLIADKISSPVKVIELKDADAIISELDALVLQINRQIQNNKGIVAAKSSKQSECNRMVWEKIAFILKDYVADYIASKKKIEDEEAVLQEKVKDLQTQYRSLTQEINDLNAGIINTADTVRSMNGYLKDSGFEGFSLHEKEGVKGGYEVIRDDGKVAVNLSEGERNFIAFLYFYHVVHGMRSETDSGKNKIVVIDDPVSSMDSSALFIVGSLVREMIGICANVADPVENENPIFAGRYIEQIFILTHNVYFHREITYQQVGYYDCTTFYMIRKTANVSHVHICERPKDKAKTEFENYNPVQSSYAALWEELRDADSVIPARNVMRRILESYFLQLCGYEGTSLREQLLEDPENRKNFIKEVPGGQPDMTDYELASTMLAYINNPNGITDGLNLVVEDYDDVDMYKRVFKQIFYVMHQNQHYDMMTAAVKKHNE